MHSVQSLDADWDKLQLFSPISHGGLHTFSCDESEQGSFPSRNLWEITHLPLDGHITEKFGGEAKFHLLITPNGELGKPIPSIIKLDNPLPNEPSSMKKR